MIILNAFMGIQYQSSEIRIFIGMIAMVKKHSIIDRECIQFAKKLFKKHNKY